MGRASLAGQRPHSSTKMGAEFKAPDQMEKSRDRTMHVLTVKISVNGLDFLGGLKRKRKPGSTHLSPAKTAPLPSSERKTPFLPTTFSI